jgi:nucleoside-diphosphate-sugar epimerase
VDVRNVVQAHVNALKTDSAQGERFALCNGTYWFKDLAGHLASSFPAHAVKHKEGGKCLFRMAACIDKQAAQIVRNWGDYKQINNKKS